MDTFPKKYLFPIKLLPWIFWFFISSFDMVKSKNSTTITSGEWLSKSKPCKTCNS